MKRGNFADAQPIADADGMMSLYEGLGLGAAVGHAKLSIAKTMMEPGASVAKHFHLKSDEIYVVLQGTGSMTVDDQQFPVGAGDIVLLEPPEKHGIVTMGDETLVFLAVSCPAYSPADHIMDTESTPGGSQQ